MARPRKGITFMDRVKAQTVEQGECLIFSGCKDSSGYGRINKDGKLVRIHRAVYEAQNGALPSSVVVMHSCDNRACWNIAHLSAGSQVDNIRDMDSKGRRTSLIGSQQPMAKLTEKSAAFIRKMLSFGVTCAALAREFGVSEGAIRHVKKNRNWTHVTGYGLT